MKRKRMSESPTSVHHGAASTSSSHAYDVFLNFRGADTRYGFVDCLYEFLTEAGIRVFMDDEALRVGDDIGDELLTAISSSRLYIPVFSRNYASSKWCLMELLWMVKCARKLDGKEILPVFFNVEPEDVKLKTELYTEDLLQHEESFGSHKVRKWRKALRKVSKMKGWNLQSNHGQGKLIRQIAGHIGHRLELKHRILPNHIIGIEEQVQDIMHALDCGSRDVRIVVIHGMGGIGKTTLASAVFNKIRWQFQGCSFLSSVRESVMAIGIVNLQNKLLRDMLKFSSHNFCDANDAMNCIQGLLQNKDALVVLDDVSDMDQIRKLIGMGNWVGLGSRVIITTRNLSCVVNANEIENNDTIWQGKKIYICHMRELNFNNSLQLLCQHAFGEYAPPHGYEQLSRDILSFTGGISLALEVIGSFLKEKRVAIWKEMLNKLKKLPHDRLYREMLMSSYEMLSDEEKEIFLDIAFFFSGKDKTSAFYYWKACNLFPETSVDTLISYALVKIGDFNRFWMHDLFKNLGREVIRKQSNGNLGRRNRLCNEDAERLLLKREGTEYIKALKLDSTHAHNFIPTELLRLSTLRFLELRGGNFVGEFKDGCLSELMWLSWQHCPPDFRGTNFCFKNLVVLRLSDSNITDTWSGWAQFKTAKNLKVLELEGLKLTRTPDLSSFVCLERLVVDECESLVHIDRSIGNLECLDSLELVDTQWLQHDIGPREGLPEVVHLPSSICNLKALTRLVIEGFILKQLPESIGELKGLKIMAIKDCDSLQNLPDSIGDLESLCKLVLCNDGITELPKSIGKLMNLTELDVSWNDLRSLPATMGDLDKLEVLDVSCNNYLEGNFLGEFDKLQSLRSLNLSGTGICRLSTWIIQMSCLESLLLEKCNEIQELPDLPTSLIRLEISSRLLKVVPDLSSLTNLVHLKLSNRDYAGHRRDNPRVLTGNTMAWIQHMQKMEDLCMDVSPMPPYLSTGLDQLCPIRRLQLSCQNSSVVSLPSGLKSLTLYHSTSLSRWELLSNLQGLSKLGLYRSGATEIWLDGLESLKNLTHLEIDYCEFLERMHDISRLRKLQDLRLFDCPKLTEIGGLSQPPDSLQHLRICCCDSIRYLPARSDAKSPSKLHMVVYDCSKLRDFVGPYDSYFKKEEREREEEAMK